MMLNARPHLGTPRIITNQQQGVVSRHDYLPFGEEIKVNTGGRTAAQSYIDDNVRQKFTQKERDNETGLDYFLARYYSSSQGRFTSPDPLLASGKTANPQSWNRYTYTINNPLKYIDPSGLIWGYYTDDKGKGHYHWYDNEDALKAAGATVVRNFIYEAENGKWIRLNSSENKWEAYDYKDQAIEQTHGPLGDNSTAGDQAFSFGLGQTGGRIVFGLVNRALRGIAGTFFGRVTAGATEEGLERVAQIRTDLNVGAGRHIAFANYNIAGESGELIAVSGQAARAGTVGVPTTRLFKTFEVGGFNRAFDSEVKILERIGQGINNPSSKGTVNLFSERPVCASCGNVVNQFKQRFPNVQVKVDSGP